MNLIFVASAAAACQKVASSSAPLQPKPLKLSKLCSSERQSLFNVDKTGCVSMLPLHQYCHPCPDSPWYSGPFESVFTLNVPSISNKNSNNSNTRDGRITSSIKSQTDFSSKRLKMSNRQRTAGAGVNRSLSPSGGQAVEVHRHAELLHHRCNSLAAGVT